MQSIELEFQLQTDRINEKIYFSLNLTFCLFSFVYLVIASIRWKKKKHTHTRSNYTGVIGFFNSSANSCTWKSTVQQINRTTGGYFNEKIRFADKTIAFGSNTSSGKCFKI